MENYMKKTILSGIFIFIISSNLIAGWKYSDYSKTDYKNFRSNPLFVQQINPSDIDYPLVNASIFFLTNEIRARNGLATLEYSKELEIAAWTHSRMMVEKNFFSHTDSTDSGRREPSDRAKLAGITNPSIAENIAEGFGIAYKAGVPVYPKNTEKGEFSYSADGPIIKPHTYISLAEALLEQWMNSPGHRSNILSKSGLQMGCGAYFYRDKSFYNMLKCRATQNFQWFNKITAGEKKDSAPEEK